MIRHRAKHLATKGEIALSYILRGGLFFSIAMVLYGGIFFFSSDAHKTFEFSTFTPPSKEQMLLTTLFKGAMNHDPNSLIQIGLLILITTPLLRVISCWIMFLYEKDYLYVILASIVLTILGYSLFTS